MSSKKGKIYKPSYLSYYMSQENNEQPLEEVVDKEHQKGSRVNSVLLTIGLASIGGVTGYLAADAYIQSIEASAKFPAEFEMLEMYAPIVKTVGTAVGASVGAAVSGVVNYCRKTVSQYRNNTPSPSD